MSNEDLKIEEHRVEWCPELAFSEKDYQRYWFHDNLHNYQPITPMGASLYHWPWGTQYAADYFTFPYSRGFELTLYDGRIYPGVMPIFDPEEIKAKEPVFMQMLMEKLDNWPQFYKEGTDELSTNLGMGQLGKALLVRQWVAFPTLFLMQLAYEFPVCLYPMRRSGVLSKKRWKRVKR